MNVVVGLLVRLVSDHGVTFLVAGLVAVTFMVLVVTGAAGRIALLLEERP